MEICGNYAVSFQGKKKFFLGVKRFPKIKSRHSLVREKNTCFSLGNIEHGAFRKIKFNSQKIGHGYF